jgi:hypothetical protein
MSHDKTAVVIPVEIAKPEMQDYKRHLPVCVGPRCTQNGESQALFDSLGEKFKAAGLDRGAARVKRTRVHCFATCNPARSSACSPTGSGITTSPRRTWTGSSGSISWGDNPWRIRSITGGPDYASG